MPQVQFISTLLHFTLYLQEFMQLQYHSTDIEEIRRQQKPVSKCGHRL